VAWAGLGGGVIAKQAQSRGRGGDEMSGATLVATQLSFVWWPRRAPGSHAITVGEQVAKIKKIPFCLGHVSPHIPLTVRYL